jgi:hypothetical protein
MPPRSDDADTERPLPSGPGSMLGDFARALCGLSPADAPTREAIAQSLGLTVHVAGTGRGDNAGDRGGVGNAGDSSTWSAAAATLEAEGGRLIEEARARRPGLLRPGRRTAEPIASTLSRMAPGASMERPSWLLDAEPLEAVPAEATPPSLDPLLVPRWTPGILTAAVARDAHDGPIDVLRLVDTIVRGQLVDELPLRPRPTLSAGVQLLVDIGEGMLPFRADVAQVEERIRRVVGEHRIDALRFDASPLRGVGPGPRRRWRPYEAPTRPRVVLAVTTLGAGSHARPDDRDEAAEWLMFADVVRSAGCWLVALVPSSLSRVPPRVRRTISVLEWDRRTTLGAAVTATRRRAR